jgi:hypothetical protein
MNSPALSFPPEMTALLPVCGGTLARVTCNASSSQVGLFHSVPAAGFASFPSHGESGADRCLPEDAKSLSLPPHNTVLTDLFHAY